MIDRRPFGRALLAATALGATFAATPASAQQIDRIIAFGDSYADTGNLWTIIGGNPYAGSLYPTGRFSGGTNYIDTLSQILDAPVDNFAIGGALTNNVNTNGPGIPGFTTEWGSFLGGGGGPFPTVSGTFDESDLVAISIGGNDARFYEQNGGSLAGAAAAGHLSAANAEVGLDALVAAGAPTISFLTGNTALLPEVAASPPLQEIRQTYSNAFNADIRDVLAGYAADGVIVHYLDGTAVLTQIQADPEAYGLTSASLCTPGAACVTSADYANQFLFYADGLHLTSAGFAILAHYVATQLNGPLTLQAGGDVALDTARQFGRTLNSRIDLAAPRDGDVAEGLNLFVVGDHFARDVGASADNRAFDIDSVGATAGVTYGFGNGVVGLAANYSRPRARFTGGESRTDVDTLQLGAFAGYSIAYAFVQGHVGYGRDDHDVRRGGVIDDLDAETDGSHWLAGAKAGWLMPLGTLRAGPVVALDYAHAKVDGYSEDGDPALALNVSDTSAKALVGGLGLEARGDFNTDGIQLRPFAAAMLEKDFAGDDRSIRFAQQTAPGIVNTWHVERSNAIYGRLSGGASAGILQRVNLDALLSTTVGRDEGNEVSAHVGLRVGL